MQSFSPADLLIHNASKSLHFSSILGYNAYFISQWNIKHSYDLIFSFKGDFGLYIFCTSLASPLVPNFRGCLYLACLFTGEVFDWLTPEWWSIIQPINSRDYQGSEAIDLQEQGRHWTQAGLISIHLIEIREAQPSLLPSALIFQKQTVIQVMRLMRNWTRRRRRCVWGVLSQKYRSKCLLLTSQSYVGTKRHDS